MNVSEGCSKLQEKETQIETQKRELNEEISTAEKLIANLQARLEKVLILSEPMKESDNCLDQDNLVPFANEIREQKQRLYFLNANIKDILKRIEL